MPSVSEYQSAIRALLSPLAAREPEWWTDPRPPATPAPRVLAADVSNPLDLPPFDNSQMDGYAVRAAEVHPGSALAVAPHIAAGAGLARLELSAHQKFTFPFLYAASLCMAVSCLIFGVFPV